jgi:N-acyl-D-aspartate/D-glutamate deacylase
VVIGNYNEAELGQMLTDDRPLLGLSDAGAHASQLCDAVFSTHLLEHWVRETSVLSLEKAVWRLSGQPASFFGLPDRGTIAPGNWADLVAFDPDVIAVEPLRRVWDLPGGTDRVVAGSQGIHWVWVNGHTIVADGKDVEGRHGRLIRDGGN